MSSLAEIVAEGKRQLANYQTMILPHGDAARLLAVAKAAVEMRRAQGAYFGLHSIGGDACRTSTRLADATAAFDRAAGEGGDRG